MTGRRITRFVRLGVRYVLLATIGLGLSIPLFDQHAIERTPWHEHLVFGGTAAERARAQEAHLRGTAWPNGSAPVRPLAALIRLGQGGKARERVSIVNTPGRLSAASIEIGGPGLAAPDSPAPLAALSRSDPLFRLDALLLTEALLFIPEPPPRSDA